jgi:hypothetical protein
MCCHSPAPWGYTVYMWPGHKRSLVPAYRAIFDVGATSVGVGVSRSTKTGNELLWHARLDYPYRAYSDYERYERTMYATLLELGMKLTSEGLPLVRDTDHSFSASSMAVAFVLTPPWFYGGVATTAHIQDTAYTVTRHMLEKLHTKGVSEILSRQDFSSWEEIMGSHELIEHVDQTILLEGYPVRSWEGKTAKEFTLTGYYAIAGSTVVRQVRTILERVLPNHHPEAYTSTRLLGELYRTTMWDGATAQAIFVEVFGQVTAVVTMRKGVMRHVRTIPTGTDRILRSVAPKAISAKEAESKLEVLLGMVTDDRRNKGDIEIPEELQEAVDEWHAAVQEEMIAQSDGVTPPELVLLMANTRWHKLLVPVLSRPFLAPGVREERSFTVQPCNTFILASHEGVDIPADAIHDVRLQVFAHTIGACEQA